MEEELRSVVRARRASLSPTSAIFWADKLWSLTGDESDLLLLAHCQLDAGDPARAVKLVQKHVSQPMCLEGLMLVAHGMSLLSEWSELLDLLSKSPEVLYRQPLSTSPLTTDLTNSQMLAKILYIKGVSQLKMEIPDKAAASFKEALELDPYCSDAFIKLSEHNLLSPAEELRLLDSLQGGHGLIKALYSTRTAQTQSTAFTESQLTVLSDAKLGTNTDVLTTHANLLYAKGQYAQSLQFTQRVLAQDELHKMALLTHIACLFKLKRKNDLFLLSHQLVDNATGHQSLPWYAVGVYYLLTTQTDKARQFFNRSISYDTNFVHAWFGFGHSFAQKDEHDSALAAYTTAARLAIRSHLPLLYMGKEYLRLNDLVAAEQFLVQAKEIAPRDALTLNELGVLYLRTGNLGAAKTNLERAIELDPSNPDLENTYVNLGHTYRKLKNYEEARQKYQAALQLNPLSATTMTALGYLNHLSGDFAKAIELYHMALGLKSDYTIASDLVARVMEDMFTQSAQSILPLIPPSTVTLPTSSSAASPMRGIAATSAESSQLDSSTISMDIE